MSQPYLLVGSLLMHHSWPIKWNKFILCELVSKCRSNFFCISLWLDIWVVTDRTSNLGNDYCAHQVEILTLIGTTYVFLPLIMIWDAVTFLLEETFIQDVEELLCFGQDVFCPSSGSIYGNYLIYGHQTRSYSAYDALYYWATGGQIPGTWRMWSTLYIATPIKWKNILDNL